MNVMRYIVSACYVEVQVLLYKHSGVAHTYGHGTSQHCRLDGAIGLTSHFVPGQTSDAHQQMHPACCWESSWQIRASKAREY